MTKLEPLLYDKKWKVTHTSSFHNWMQKLQECFYFLDSSSIFFASQRFERKGFSPFSSSSFVQYIIQYNETLNEREYE